MSFFDIFKKKEIGHDEQCARELYSKLMSFTSQPGMKTENLEEGMEVANEIICQYWKPRFLLNHNTKCAYEFMSNSEYLKTVTENDIDWDSLKELPEKAVDRAHRLYAGFPTRIRKFENGVAQVNWQLNPDGMYYMDEDGYGMTDDDEVEIYGFINQQGKVVVKFKHIQEDWNLLKAMRKEAESITNK